MGVLPAIDQLRAKIRRLEVGDRRLNGVLPFGLAAMDARLPGGGLAMGALHEVAGGGNGALDGAAAALFGGHHGAHQGAGSVVRHPAGFVCPGDCPGRAGGGPGDLCRGRGR